MTELVDAQFYTPLKTTLVPTNGAGTPTFTRATTKNVFDNDGKLISIKSGAVALAGARVSQNNLPANFSSWSNINMTVTSGISDPDGGFSAYKLTAMAASASVNKSLPIPDGAARYWFVFWIKRITGSGDVVIYSDASPIVLAGVTAEWKKFIVPDNENLVGLLNFIRLSTAGDEVAVWRPQDEYRSAVAAEYIDSLTDYGAGAPGVKYFDTDSSGVAIPDATMLGAHIDPESKTNNLLWCRDLTNAAWVKTNATAAKTQTGIDAVTSACSLLTAAAANATALQTITAAATAACSGFWVKRSVGTGSIFFTRNGGTDWLDITSLINSSTFTCVKIENTSVTNPSVGFKIATSGDAIIVDAGLNHAGTTLTLPIFTTSAAVTRAADVLTYQTASNFSDTAGTILATYKPTYDTYTDGSIVGSSTRGLYASTSNSGVQALDGTNTINGPTGTPSGQIRIGARWSGSSLQCFALDSFGSSGSYDGSFNLSTIGILPGTAGYIRDLAIWTSSLTDNEIRDAWNLITTYITSGSLVGMQSILSSSTSSISTVIYGSITATYVQPTLTAAYTAPTIEAEI